MNQSETPKKGPASIPRVLRPGQCEHPPCDKCPDWPTCCMSCGYAKAITPEQYEEEMAILAAEAEERAQRQSIAYITEDETGGMVLVANIPHTKECVACGMDDSMESDLSLCPTCHCCTHWEYDGLVGSCCRCPQKAGG